MTNKHFMTFRTAVRKYEDMHEKSTNGLKKPKKFWTINA
jgi:hypothetical protein